VFDSEITMVVEGKNSKDAVPSQENRGTRYRNTDNRIKEAFLDLISEISFAEMTIAGVCKSANVGRNTFYEHYPDLLSVSKACILGLIDKSDFMPSQARHPGWSKGEAGEPMCILIRRDRRYASMLFDPYLSDMCAGMIIEKAVMPTVKTLSDESHAGESAFTAVCCTSVRGCLQSIRENLDKSDEEWSVIKESIDRYNRGGLRMICLRF